MAALTASRGGRRGQIHRGSGSLGYLCSGRREDVVEKGLGAAVSSNEETSWAEAGSKAVGWKVVLGADEDEEDEDEDGSRDEEELEEDDDF